MRRIHSRASDLARSGRPRGIGGRTRRRGRRWASRLGLAAAGVLAASAVAVPAAFASPGDLTFAGCTGDLAGCSATTPAGALDGAAAVVRSGDRSQLYAISDSNSSVSHFTIDAAGNLTYAGCAGQPAGCTATTPAGAIDRPTALAVTPYGGNLYVASWYGEIAHFRTDSAGNLTFLGCFGGIYCTHLPGNPAADGLLTGMAFGHTGFDLYATSYRGDVLHFTLDTAGNLTFAGCYGVDVGCTAHSGGTWGDELYGAWGLTVSPGGHDLFTASQKGNAISHFAIDTAGNLTYTGCTGDFGGCTPTYVSRVLDGASAVIVSPDGTHLYAAGGNGVSQFTIESGGILAFTGCDGSLSGCNVNAGPPGALNGADALAITVRTGYQLYAAAAGAVIHFTIDYSGDLHFAGCAGLAAGCAGTAPATALRGADGLAEIGSNVYVASYGGNSVSNFRLG